MDEGSVGILLLVIFSVFAAVIFHLRGRGFLLASFTSAITAITALLLVDTIRRGTPDPRIAGAFVIGGVIAFLIALIVGWITRWWVSRRKKEDQENP